MTTHGLETTHYMVTFPLQGRAQSLQHRSNGTRRTNPCCSHVLMPTSRAHER
jgi:hypothetical protein